MSRRPLPAHPNRAALRNAAFAVLVVALFVAVFPIGGTGHAGGVPLVPRGAPLSAPAVGRSGSNAALGDRFPAPLGGPDPTLSAAATPAVQRLLQHRTEVASLVAHRGVGYTYATGVAWLAYAPWDHAFYVAAPPSSVDEILAGSTTVAAVIAVGAAPFGVAVDDATDQVWVTNTGSNNVTVINGTTQSVVANIPVPSEPLGIAVNPAQARVFVADNGTNQTSVINATSDSVLANTTVGDEPIGVAFDGATDRMFVSDFGSNEVTVLNGFTGQGLGNVSVGLKPIGLAVDNATDTVYVANQGSQNVSVITAGSATVNATVPIPTEGYDPSLQGVAYDAAHHLIWVTAGFTAVVINTSEERAVDEVNYDPAGIAYDPANGNVCLTNSANVTFGCFTFGSGLQVDANVTFSETGLPPGTPWIVTLSPGPLTFGLGSSIRQTITGASIVIGVDVWFHAPGYNYSFT
ncbi:MAG: YncE family protein, partial [Thermoplasmata archaeon]|nr:YncE family protein [Thermoplasmata archaeon]